MECQVSVYRAGSLKIVTSNLVAVQDIRWVNGGSESGGCYTFFCGNGSANCHLGTEFFIS
jgi:hypothetical protein